MVYKIYSNNDMIKQWYDQTIIWSIDSNCRALMKPWMALIHMSWFCPVFTFCDIPGWWMLKLFRKLVGNDLQMFHGKEWESWSHHRKNLMLIWLPIVIWYGFKN